MLSKKQQSNYLEYREVLMIYFEKGFIYEIIKHLVDLYNPSK